MVTGFFLQWRVLRVLTIEGENQEQSVGSSMFNVHKCSHIEWRSLGNTSRFGSELNRYLRADALTAHGGPVRGRLMIKPPFLLTATPT